MNQYEKLGTLLSRTAGGVCAVQNILDLFHTFGILGQFHAPVSSLTFGSYFWPLTGVAIGVLIFAVAKPIGRFLAKGLDDSGNNSPSAH